MPLHPDEWPNSLTAPLQSPAPHLRPGSEERPTGAAGYSSAKTPESELGAATLDRYWGSALGLLVALCLVLAGVVWWLLLTLP